MSNNCYSFEQVGNSLYEGDKIHYRGIVESSCGHVTLLPYDAEKVVRHNIVTNSQVATSVACINFNHTHRLKKSVGAVKASCGSGLIYGGAENSASPITVPPTGNLPGNVSTVVNPNMGPSLQTRGPVDAHNGTVIVTPGYGGNGNTGKWHRVDTIGNSLMTAITTDDHPETAQQFVQNPNWDEMVNVTESMWKTMYGGVAGNNGKIYGIPSGAAYVNIYRESTFGSGPTAEWRTPTEVTGLAPVTGVLDNIEGIVQSTVLHKYRGGALAGNGCIYAHGERARGILKINTASDAVTEIPYPQEIVDAMCWVEAVEPGVMGPGVPAHADTSTTRTRKSASGGSVLGGDGKVYNIPRGIPYLIWIDPSDDSIGFMKIEGILNFTGASFEWYGDAVAIDNNIFYAPAKAHKIMKVTLPSNP